MRKQGRLRGRRRWDLTPPPLESQWAELSALETLLKVPARLLLSELSAPIRPTAMMAAIRPYSIAVAPDSSF